MRCDVCGQSNAERHHVYGNANRKISEKLGAVVYLCPTHHRSQPEGIHGGNIELANKYKRKHQMIFELDLMREGISQEDARMKFICLIGKSFL